MKRYRTAIIGFGHMHINHVASLYAAHPLVEWVGCADTQPLTPELRAAPYTREWNQRHVMGEFGIPRAYDDYHELLEQEQPEIVIVTCENAQHPDVVTACAAVGAHVCIEKPMAASLQDALRMVRACQAGGTTMLVNWPSTWSTGQRKAKALIDEGAIGRVLECKWRSGHTGPLGPSAAHAGVSQVAEPMSGPERAATWWHQSAAGGGAMLDFCCYGTVGSRWYVGEPAQAVLGLKANLDSPYGDAEDNAVMLVRFPSALALLEGSWTTRHHGVATGPIVYGTDGTLVVEEGGAGQRVRLERGGDRSEIVAADPLPAGRENVAQELIHHLETGEPVHRTLEMLFNLEVMAILDAGVRSAASGRLELVNSAVWCLG
ncbi:MAG: Gfo/Idh/MocA family oxidoreductase [Anaerolineae bacterium]|nr:Gfo/Idh/MocA family oxidoreductase [Anaerolineae bacterium]